MTDACPECDLTVHQDAYITGVVTRHHTPEFHTQYRKALIKWASWAILGRIGHLDGHRITIRFTADHAWYECACREKGIIWRDSGSAIADGHRHQQANGAALMAWIEMVHLGQEIQS